ncbi:hypothetical protein HYW75_01005 [Candidatus Pacearchaeota archaeon]|nr:hypothetical protein [Candidatus Pacearchaeota archaeon]
MSNKTSSWKSYARKKFPNSLVQLTITPLFHYEQLRKGYTIPITYCDNAFLAEICKINRDSFEYTWHDGDKQRKGVIKELHSVMVFKRKKAEEHSTLEILAGNNVYPYLKF